MYRYFVENFVQLLDFQQVALVKGYLLASDAANPVQAGGGLLLADAVCEVIDGHHVVAGLQQRQYAMAADVSCAARDENRLDVRHGIYIVLNRVFAASLQKNFDDFRDTAQIQHIHANNLLCTEVYCLQ